VRIRAENRQTARGRRKASQGCGEGVTPDMLPVVGELPGYRNIYLATGHCRLGVTLAPVTAELILSRIQGARSELSVDVVEIVSLGRFIR
jgi:glycine/D-amino acid oxidase-like deaminating enzyme